MRKNGGRATVHDLARVAGVSLATVDRVLNGRPGVRPETVEKVEAAVASLGFRRDLNASMLARARDLDIVFVIPEGTNQFMTRLADAVERVGMLAGAERTRFRLERVRPMDGAALAARIDALLPEAPDCLVIVAPDRPELHAAIDRAMRGGIKVITLVSDVPGSARAAFVGIDNVAAGRTAASLLGRFCPGPGRIGVVAGSLGLRDHRDRLEGFRGVLEAEFPHLAIVGPIEGHDDFSRTYEISLAFLRQTEGLVGLYNIGAGNAGLIMALGEAGLARRLRVVVHELTGPTRAGLLSGAVDVVLDQNPEDEIRAVWAAARRLALGTDAGADPAPIEIGVFLRDNLR